MAYCVTRRVTCIACIINNVGDSAMSTKEAAISNGVSTRPPVTPNRLMKGLKPNRDTAAEQIFTTRSMLASA